MKIPPGTKGIPSTFLHCLFQSEMKGKTCSEVVHIIELIVKVTQLEVHTTE